MTKYRTQNHITQNTLHRMNGNAGLYPEYTLHTTQNTQNAQIKIIPMLITEYTLHRTNLLMQKKINQNT